MISIILPYKTWDVVVAKCCGSLIKQSYTDFEIILLPDERTRERQGSLFKYIETGPVLPSVKRNIGMRNAKGDVFAFIDSDAYAHKDWLKNAIARLQPASVGVVGGPNLAPENASWLERAAIDMVYCSLGTGGSYKIGGGDVYESREMASSNMVVKAHLAKEFVFDETLLTSEDSKMCYDIRNAGFKILYDPSVKVWHHRRPLFWPHLSRMFVQGRDKAKVVKQMFGKDKLIFFVPSMFTLYLMSLPLLLWWSKLFLIPLLFYPLAVLMAVWEMPITTKIPNLLGIPLTHMFYGLGFIKGMLR